MAKINVINNKNAMFILCEAIAGETEEWEGLQTDENGMYDLKIEINGKEINVERFIENLNRTYQEAVKRQAADLLKLEYGKILSSIYDIQETLEYHNELFDEKVFV